MADQAVHALPVVEVAAFHHRSRHGGSRSLVVQASTGSLVLVKFQANPQSTRALVNELVGTLIGRMAGAPFPRPVLVRVPGEAIAALPILQTAPWRPGLQLGIEFHPEAVPLLRREQVRALTNLDRLPVTALVETWLFNIDLKPTHFMRMDGPAGGEFLAVDHGHILPHGPAWRRRDLDAYADEVPDMSALNRLARWAGIRFHFSAALDACESLDDDAVSAVIASVPPEWGLGHSHARRLRRFLSHRRGRLRSWADRIRLRWNA